MFIKNLSFLKQANPAVLMLFATVSLLGMQSSVKALAHYPPAQLVVLRSAFVALIMAFLIHKNKLPFWGNDKKTLTLRGIIGAIALILSYYSLQKLPLAVSVSIQHLSPLFAAIIGVFVLKEPLKFSHLFGFLLAMSGVLLIEGFEVRVETLPFFILLLATAFASMGYNLVRKLRLSDHPFHVIFYICFVSAVFGLFLLPNSFKPFLLEDWPIYLLLCFSTLFYQLFMTYSLHGDTLSQVMPMKYIGVILSLFVGWFSFGEEISWAMAFGLTLILLGIITVKYGQTFKR